jgi:hypothetical protein
MKQRRRSAGIPETHIMELYRERIHTQVQSSNQTHILVIARERFAPVAIQGISNDQFPIFTE